jgi:hypothetical protein
LPFFAPMGHFWRHDFFCVGTLLCWDVPTLTYHEQTILTKANNRGVVQYVGRAHY